MFHSSLDDVTKARVLNSFKDNGILRCVVCTIAFGMGVDIPDIRFIINWGAPSSVLEYWQQVGRCCRDGEGGVAVAYMLPKSLGKVGGKEMTTDGVKALANEDRCLRVSVLKTFAVGALKEDAIFHSENIACHNCLEAVCTCACCRCCKICKSACSCTNKFATF
jgi:superfamily II DNA helicase RecQ